MKKNHLFITIVVAVSMLQCQSEFTKDGADSFKKQSDQKQIFTKLESSKTGISFQNNIVEDSKINNYNFAYIYNGGAVGLGDINNDGLTDMYLTSVHGSNKLYLNKGNLNFEDITATAGVAAEQGTKFGVTMVDINNDGYLDIYQCRSGVDKSVISNLLFINQKNNTFKESAQAYGLVDYAPSNNANFFDYDNDGDLDMYLLNHPVDFTAVFNLPVQKIGNQYIKAPIPTNKPDESNKLFKNNGNNTFTEVTNIAGLQSYSFSLSSAITDVNRDGYLDMYVCNDYSEPDYLYINNKNGTFTNKIDQYLSHYSYNSMGSDAADINNDGLIDLLTTDMLPENNARQKLLKTSMINYKMLQKFGFGDQLMRNMLHINNGYNFSEVAYLAGIAETDWSWSPLIEDFDNDGFKDISITNGFYHDITNQDYISFSLDSLLKTCGGNYAKLNIAEAVRLIPQQPLRNYMYHNNGDLTFEDVSDSWGFTEKTSSNGSAYADLDNDGDMELVINNIAQPVSIYQNNSRQIKPENNYLQIKLEGSPKNPKGIGAKVSLKYGNQQQYEEMNPTRGFLSSSQHLLHFGLGNCTKIDEMKIIWQEGKTQILKDILPNQCLNIKFDDAESSNLAGETIAKTIFSPVQMFDFRHIENLYDDFDREYLIPRKLSTQGPCFTKGDVNGDGLDDFYIGGATNTAGAMYVQNPNSSFSKVSINTWEAEKAFEDVGAILFDADGDKDNDLYIASGGNDYAAGNPLYNDRIYFNDGKGNFTKGNSNLPTTSFPKKAVVAYDFDKDGDLDIVVGARSNPWQYPSPPTSFILQNTKGIFKNVTAELAPDFQKFGMITDLNITDLNNDGNMELIIAGEWMPISVFQFDGKIFKNNTANFGLTETAGWWNCIKTADIDKDGDIDILAGNIGLNTRYKANISQPMQIFYKDFDQNGKADPILAWYREGKCYPVALKDDFTKQMPSYKKEYLHYRDYAKATINDIFGRNLKDANRLFVNTLASTFFENTPNGFVPHALPNEAQMSPIYDFVINDINNDNINDIVAVGNSTAEWLETGTLDGSCGSVLLGDGKNGFKFLPSRNAGLWATREARHLSVINLANKKQLYLIANNNDLLQSFVKN